jgi:hypothetical protein
LSLSQEQLQSLARHGAQARIAELRHEIAAIEQAFPDLRPRRRGRPSKQSSASAAPAQAESATTSNGAAAKPRGRRGWSAAARKAAAARMKAYWRKRKAGRKK